VLGEDAKRGLDAKAGNLLDRAWHLKVSPEVHGGEKRRLARGEAGGLPGGTRESFKMEPLLEFFTSGT